MAPVTVWHCPLGGMYTPNQTPEPDVPSGSNMWEGNRWGPFVITPRDLLGNWNLIFMTLDTAGSEVWAFKVGVLPPWETVLLAWSLWVSPAERPADKSRQCSGEN